MKIYDMISTLLLIFFYTSIPLLLPLGYAYYFNEPTFYSILIVVLIMMAPSAPALFPKFAKKIIAFFDYIIQRLFRREAPWNYAISVFTKRPVISNMTFGEILAITSLAWIVIPAITAYPYLMSGFSIHDSLFESMSGWTSTGLSIMATSSQIPENLPKSLILYRSVTQWIGGLGIILLMLALFKHRQAKKLLQFEGKSSLDVGITNTAKKYWLIYGFLTLLAIIALVFSGFDIFYSVNLAFAGLSNGGFFPFSKLNPFFIQKVILAGTMFLGSISFITYNKAFSGKIKAFLGEEFLLLIAVILISGALMYFVSYDDISNSFMNIISAIASGGFAIGDLTVMHQFSLYLLIILMICGGMYASTSGGLKIWRLLVALKFVKNIIRSYFLPTGTVQIIQVDGSPVPNHILPNVLIFMFLYLLILVGAAGVFMAWNFGIVDSLFIVASAMGNVGLSTINIAAQCTTIQKYFIIALMYIGRIEIFPVLALIRFIIPKNIF